MGRDHRLDTVRAYGMLFVVAAHVAIAYMVTPVGWAIQDDSQHLGVDLFVWIARGLVMPLFFWLSGYFSRALYERGALVRHRVTRVLLPLLVLVVPCALVLQQMWAWGRDIAGKPAIATNVPRVDGEDWSITLAHLWFLYYLLATSALAMIAVPIARRLRIPGAGAAVVIVLIVVPLVHAGKLALVTPIGFVPDLDVLAYHTGFFAWGWIAQARARDLDRYQRRSWELLGLAALLLLAVTPTLIRTGDHDAPDRAPVYAILASAGFTIALVAAFIGTCARFTSGPSRLVRLAADASYPTYIAHLPIVVGLQLVAALVALPGPLEFAVIIAVTMIACVAGYGAVTRLRRKRAKSSPNGDSSR